MEDLQSIEPWVRTGAFVGLVVVLAGAAWRWPRRPPRGLRELGPNLSLFLLNTAVVRLVAASSLLGVAMFAQSRGWGLFNVLDAPGWLEFGLAVLLLDLGVYIQHRVFHWLPWLWRLHAVHHADTAFDLSTGLRFHTGEILVSLAIKMGLVLLVGATPVAALVFEVLLSSSSLFTHANLRLPLASDRLLRWLIVTPDMHRIHHGVSREEHDRNFGFLVSWWDRLFGSYRADPALSHERMTIGLETFRRPEQQHFVALLRQPFAAVRPD